MSWPPGAYVGEQLAFTLPSPFAIAASSGRWWWCLGRAVKCDRAGSGRQSIIGETSDEAGGIFAGSMAEAELIPPLAAVPRRGPNPGAVVLRVQSEASPIFATSAQQMTSWGHAAAAGGMAPRTAALRRLRAVPEVVSTWALCEAMRARIGLRPLTLPQLEVLLCMEYAVGAAPCAAPASGSSSASPMSLAGTSSANASVRELASVHDALLSALAKLLPPQMNPRAPPIVHAPASTASMATWPGAAFPSGAATMHPGSTTYTSASTLDAHATIADATKATQPQKIAEGVQAPRDAGGGVPQDAGGGIAHMPGKSPSVDAMRRR